VLELDALHARAENRAELRKRALAEAEGNGGRRRGRARAAPRGISTTAAAKKHTSAMIRVFFPAPAGP
jgi:hypothetical protein